MKEVAPSRYESSFPISSINGDIKEENTAPTHFQQSVPHGSEFDTELQEVRKQPLRKLP